MEVQRVQRWVMSALLLTVTFILAGGMALLSATSVHAGARPGLLIIAVILGLVGIAGIRVINALPPFTPWLVLGALPALVGWLLTR